MTDQELLTNYLNGDPAAFAELVQRHGDWVWGCALRQAPDSATAEDVTQAAFLLMARKAAALQRHGSLHRWLFRVVQFLAKDARKLAVRRQYHEMKVAAMKQEQTQGSTDWDALQRILDAAVAKLRDGDRQAILLRFYVGLPFAEVGRTMELSEDAATKRVSRAVARLKAILGNEGISVRADVQSLLSTGLSCSAPAALIAQTAANHSTPAAAALATKAAHLLAAAKFRAAAVLVAGVVVAASATTGVIITTRPAAPATSVPAAPPAAVVAVAPEIPAPPIRPGKQATAVNRTIFALRQADTGRLIAASRQVSTNQATQAYVGDANALRPILSTVLTNSVSAPSLDWQSKYSAGFGVGPDSKQLAFGPGNDRELLYLEGNDVISAGKITQIAGSVSLSGYVNAASISFAPFTIGTSEIRFHVMPLTLPRTGAVDLVFAFEAVPVDVADRDPLSQMTDAAAWFAQPRNKTLRTARAGAVWQSMVPENMSSAARLRALKLPGGASIWVRCISDESVDRLAAWTADGQPAEVMRAGKPTLRLKIEDPNLPPFIFSNTNTYEGWPAVPLIQKSAGGYACTIGYGDGKYSTVASLPARRGATANFAGCALTIGRIEEHGMGDCRLAGTLPKDTEFDLVAVLKDGSWKWNMQRNERHVEEGKQPVFPDFFSFDTDLTQITHLEVRSRPLKWVTFEHLAARPVVALPTGMEPPVDPNESKRQILASATPADRKAFLDKVNCVRYWGRDRSDVKRDLWMWRDGRYRSETWTKDGHTLVLGDKKTARSYDPQTGTWTEKREAPGPEMGSFAEMMAEIGGMESVIALGETTGTEPIHGTPCTIRVGRLESHTAKVWLDSLGIIHRLDYSPPESESVIIDYDPTDAEKVWTPPGASASAEPVRRYESAAEAFLAKAMPADKPITSITAAGRTFDLLSIKRIREDLAIICTSTALLPESCKHRDDTGERWQATQMYGTASWSNAWVPRVIARLHMPYREITWWSLRKGGDCKAPDVADVLVVLGQAAGSFPMEGWIESQPNPTRMHQLSIDLLQADRVDLDTYLREVYQMIESYRKTVGEAGSDDFITASDTWEKFKQTADSAIAGHEAISSSGR